MSVRRILKEDVDVFMMSPRHELSGGSRHADSIVAPIGCRVTFPPWEDQVWSRRGGSPGVVQNTCPSPAISYAQQ